MKRFLMLIALSFVLSSLFSVSTYYKENRLPEGTSATNSQEVASVPVTLDLAQVSQAHVDMGFYSDGSNISNTTNIPDIALIDNNRDGRIDAFDGHVYAYCNVVSTKSVVISIMGKGPLETNAQSTNNIFNWQVSATIEGVEKVFFKGLEGEYGSVKDAPLLTHNPIKDGKIKSSTIVELSVESEDYRGKVVGDYKSCLYMVITSIG